MNHELQGLLNSEIDLKKLLEKFSRSHVCRGIEIFTPFVEIGNPESYYDSQSKIRKYLQNE
jgi:hypothetical protein